MRFCMPHWNYLRQQLDEAGIAYSRSKEQLEEVGVDNDPLMRAHNAILANCMNAFGRDVYGVPGDACPVCHFEVEPWLDNAVEDRIKESKRTLN